MKIFTNACFSLLSKSLGATRNLLEQVPGARSIKMKKYKYREIRADEGEGE